MLKNIVLKATTRKEAPGKVKSMRVDGFLPAVVYGQGAKAQSLKIDANDFVKAYDIAGESSLINLEIDGAESIKAIIKSVQRHRVRNTFIHADIYKVNMKEKIEIEIPLNFIGEAKAEKELGGMLMRNHDSVSGSCLPSDLVENIDVDISKLETFNDSIKVQDLDLPKGVEIILDSNETIAQVAPPRIEEEEETTEIQVEDGEAEAKDGEEGEEAKVEDKKE